MTGSHSPVDRMQFVSKFGAIMSNTAINTRFKVAGSVGDGLRAYRIKVI
jgi:hypothetical protein